MQRKSKWREALNAIGAESVQAGVVLAKCAFGLTTIAVVTIVGLRSPIDLSAPVRHAGSVASKSDARAKEAKESKPNSQQLSDARRAPVAEEIPPQLHARLEY